MRTHYESQIMNNIATKNIEERKQNLITYQIKWDNIPITINYIKNYWKSCLVSHLEIKCNEPLPITNTGYRSIWLFDNDPAHRDIKTFVITGLNEAQNKKSWLAYKEEKKQKALKAQQFSLF